MFSFLKRHHAQSRRRRRGRDREGESLAAALPAPLARLGSGPGVLVRHACVHLCSLGPPLRLLSSLLAGLLGRTRLLREACPDCKPTDGRAWAELPPASVLMTSRVLQGHTATSLLHSDAAHLRRDTSSSPTPSTSRTCSSSGGSHLRSSSGHLLTRSPTSNPSHPPI